MKVFFVLCISMVVLVSCSKEQPKQDEGINLKEYEKKMENQESIAETQSATPTETPSETPSEPADVYPNKPPKVYNRGSVSGDYTQASTRILTSDELRYMSKKDLLLMRNEIFARHGYIFKRDDLYNHFITKPWYLPRHTNVENYLTQIEKENIRLIKAFENL